MIFKKENWFFCELCDCVAYRFECCSNTSCNGGGCEICDSAHSLIQASAPPREGLPVRLKLDWDEFFNGKYIK